MKIVRDSRITRRHIAILNQHRATASLWDAPKLPVENGSKWPIAARRIPLKSTPNRRLRHPETAIRQAMNCGSIDSQVVR
ncbi:hypothetical protein PATSB16_24640 [Pandoraea thiooxydans]|nr:hypothetical protein PATSB16_24640 [Pandoraea thiooxydans]